MGTPVSPAGQGESWLLICAIAIFILAVALLWYTGNRRKSLGLPTGRIITADTQRWNALQQSFYDPQTGLSGRPDYVLERSGRLIPVEVKSQQIGAEPYEAHIYQLAAYCWLVEQHFQKRPRSGILHYANRTFEIDYTPMLETSLLNLLEEMRSQGKDQAPDRSHNSAGRCRGCGFRAICDHRLL